jgi:hypothetical protein
MLQDTHRPATHAGVAELSVAHSDPLEQTLHVFEVESQMGAAVPHDEGMQGGGTSPGRPST